MLTKQFNQPWNQVLVLQARRETRATWALQGSAAWHCRNPTADTGLATFWVVLPVFYPTTRVPPSSGLQNTGTVWVKRAWVSACKWSNRYLTAECRRNNDIICLSSGLGSSLLIPSTNSSYFNLFAPRASHSSWVISAVVTPWQTYRTLPLIK